MGSITIYPKNKKQAFLLKSLLEEMKIRFETEEDNTLLLEEAFYAKIDKSIAQAELGKTKILSEEEQKELLN